MCEFIAQRGRSGEQGYPHLSLNQTLQEEGEFPMGQVTAIIGAHNAELCPTLIHLTLADSAYSLMTTPTTAEETEDVERVREEVEG